MTDLVAFKFSSADFSEDEGFDAWRRIMARMFSIERTASGGAQPSGGLSAFLLGDVMANHSVFTAQRLTRDHHRIGATPDHIVLQLYRAGGFAGEMNGESARIARGQVAICDLRRPLDVQAIASSTIGITIPRHLLDAKYSERLPPRLPPSRERLLAARMTAFHHQLPTLARSEVPIVVADLVAALRRLLDLSDPVDLLNTPEFGADLLTLARQSISSSLGSSDLSPDVIAGNLGVSRATLYRVFEPVGGIMEQVWAMRLDSVRAALEQALEPRTLTRLAADFGFKSLSHLSRSFRARYQISPSEWRRLHAIRSRNAWQVETARLNACWSNLSP